jgi:hypothetical protein
VIENVKVQIYFGHIVNMTICHLFSKVSIINPKKSKEKIKSLESQVEHNYVLDLPIVQSKKLEI